MKSILLPCVLLVAALPAREAFAQVAVGNIGDMKLTFQGLLQVDVDWYDSDTVDLDAGPRGGANADYAWRNAQFVYAGAGPGNFSWVVGFNAQNDRWLDVNARYRFGTGGSQSLQAGQYKQPNGLEELTSAALNDFMSLAMITNTYAVGRRVGVAYVANGNYARGGAVDAPGAGSDSVRTDTGSSGGPTVASTPQGNWTITASAFGNSIDDVDRGRGGGVRGTWAPINAPDRILHLGLSFVDYATDADSVRLRARPDADLTPVRLVDTGTLANSDRIATIGAEAAWMSGRWKLQGEYMATHITRGDGLGSFNGDGGYASAMVNLNGGHWVYRSGIPQLQVGPARGAGLWQLGLRYDTIDLDDGAVSGGHMDTWTTGVNWYWHSNLKVVLNYVDVASERRGVTDNPDITEARLQLYW